MNKIIGYQCSSHKQFAYLLLHELYPKLPTNENVFHEQQSYFSGTLA